MRISDGSSDVCSSDLSTETSSGSPPGMASGSNPTPVTGATSWPLVSKLNCIGLLPDDGVSSVPSTKTWTFQSLVVAAELEMEVRSEERRGGKECVGTCRNRWSPDHLKKKRKQR